MKNYIYLDGKKIEISDETANNFKEQFKVEREDYNSIVEKLFSKDFFFTGLNGEIIGARDVGRCHPNNSSTREQLESIFALNKLANVAKYLNGDWLPDWDSFDEKHCIVIQNDEIAITSFYKLMVPSVYFKTEELAEKAIDILGENEVRKALTLNH